MRVYESKTPKATADSPKETPACGNSDDLPETPVCGSTKEIVTTPVYPVETLLVLSILPRRSPPP